MELSVIYSSPFVPAEWVAVHGFKPCRVAPRGGEEEHFPFPQTGVCPYAAAFAVAAAQESGVAAIIVTTTCDQMRRIAERLAAVASVPVFVLHVPTTAGTAPASRMYADEIDRLGRFLERLGGLHPTPRHLAEVMERFDAGRNALRAARTSMRPRRFTEAIIRFQQGDWITLDESLSLSLSVSPSESVSLSLSPSPSESQSASQSAPIAVLGGPLTWMDLDLFDVIEQAGGRVVLDATETGERSLPRPFVPQALQDRPLDELLDAYFSSMPDAFQRPHSSLHEWLRVAFHERGVRGIVFRHHLWCDTWQAEIPRLREWTEIPILVLDAVEDGLNLVRATGRIQAFLETLR